MSKLVKDLPVAKIYVFRPEGGATDSYEALIAAGLPNEPDCQDFGG